MTTLDDLDAFIKVALNEGAVAAELLREEMRGYRVHREPGMRPALSTFAADRVTVRVWADGGRVGVMEGAPHELRDLIGQALASTYESPEDPFAGPVGRLDGPAAALSIRDLRYDRLTDEARLDVVRDIRDQLRADRRFEHGPILYEDRLRRRSYVNSRGVRLEEEDTRFHVEAGIAGNGINLRQHTTSRVFATVASLPLGTTLVQRGKALSRKGKQLPAGPVRVVLPPLPMSRLLAAIGDRIAADGGTPRGFLADARFAPKLHVVDDGIAPGGLRSCSFDDRGVPPVPIAVIREGRLGASMLGPERARQLGVRPTGHCYGAGLRSGNLVMREGTRSINALLTERGGPSLVIDDLADLRGLDLHSGELDLPVDGVVMDGNQAVGAMVGVRLRGNLGDLLDGVVEICNNTDRIGHVDAASIIADGLHLAI